jgi:hypothetical protein
VPALICDLTSHSVTWKVTPHMGKMTLHLISHRFLSLVRAIFLASAIVTHSLAGDFYSCKPVDVSVYPERIHVRCDKPTSGGIVFFAVPTAADPAHVARILSVLLIARATGKTVVVEYDPADTSGKDFGCGATDCRRLGSVGF